MGTDWGAIDLAVEAIDPLLDDPSAAVRAMAIRECSRSLGVAAERLTIGRDGRIPTIELDGSRTSLSLSLSHHGRWISYAMRLHIDLRNRSDWVDAWVDSSAQVAGRAWTK
jgi:hypothetical protein